MDEAAFMSMCKPIGRFGEYTRGNISSQWTAGRHGLRQRHAGNVLDGYEVHIALNASLVSMCDAGVRQRVAQVHLTAKPQQQSLFFASPMGRHHFKSDELVRAG